jgi:hypothetical protein
MSGTDTNDRVHCRCERRDEESARELARLPRYGDEFQALTVGHHELRLVKVVKRALSRDLAPSQD